MRAIFNYKCSMYCSRLQCMHFYLWLQADIMFGNANSKAESNGRGFAVQNCKVES